MAAGTTACMGLLSRQVAQPSPSSKTPTLGTLLGRCVDAKRCYSSRYGTPGHQLGTDLMNPPGWVRAWDGGPRPPSIADSASNPAVPEAQSGLENDAREESPNRASRCSTVGTRCSRSPTKTGLETSGGGAE